MKPSPLEAEHGVAFHVANGRRYGLILPSEEQTDRRYPCLCGFRAKNNGGRNNHIIGWHRKQRAARAAKEATA